MTVLIKWESVNIKWCLTVLLVGELWRGNGEQKKFKNSIAAAAAAKSLQLCLTLCDPTDGSPPGSPVPGNSIAGWLFIFEENATSMSW